MTASPFSGLGKLHALDTLTRFAGGVELGARALVLAPLTAEAAYRLSGWLVLVALKLIVTRSQFDVAARERGNERTSTSRSTLTGCSSATIVRVEWPMVKILRLTSGAS